MLTDAELVDGVVAGYDDAFAQLYQRHSLAAWRLGQTVTGNADDAADAVSEAFARVLVAVRAGHLDNGGSFRSYLLTATRNAALDNIRKTGRTRPTEQESLSEVESSAPTPSELLTGDEEAALVAEAFRNLPERWQSVLWLTEVEGVATKDAARRLGLSPNGTAQLAVRARSGLRERFLQAHLRAEPPPACRTTVERLGAYVGGGLSPRDLAKVDQHLAGCAPCEARRKELEDLGTCLRRAGVPVPLALAAAAGTGGSTVLFTLGEKVARMTEWAQQAFAQKAAAAAAAGALALGAGGAYVAGSGSADAPPATSAALAAADPAAPAPSEPADFDAAVPEPVPGPAGSEPAPPLPEVTEVPADDRAELGTGPGCVRTGVDLGDVATVSGQASDPPLTRESRRGGERAAGDDGSSDDGGPIDAANPDDGDERVAALGGIIEHDGLDGDAETPSSMEVDTELELGDLAARLALEADMARRGLKVGVDVGDGSATTSTDCGAGLAGGLELGGHELGAP